MEGLCSRPPAWGAVHRSRGHPFDQPTCRNDQTHPSARHYLDCFGTVPDRARRRALAASGLVSPYFGHHRRTRGRRHPLRMATVGTLGPWPLPWRRPHLPRLRLDRLFDVHPLAAGPSGRVADLSLLTPAFLSPASASPALYVVWFRLEEPAPVLQAPALERKPSAPHDRSDHLYGSHLAEIVAAAFALCLTADYPSTAKTAATTPSPATG